MARRHSAPEADLRRFLDSQRHSNTKKGTESLGSVMSSSYIQLPTPAPVHVPVPRLLEIVVSQGAGTRTRPPLRHKSSITTDIDEYVSEILVESLHWLGDQLESVSNALGGSVSVLEKEIKVRLQNTSVNTVIHLNPNTQVTVNSEENYTQESERIQERASSLHRLHQLFEEAKEVSGESLKDGEDLRAPSPAGSLVDSLDEPVPCLNTRPLTPPNTHPDKSEAFFISIDGGSCKRDTVKVADHMPEKIRRSLNRRQRKREKRIERARRMRNRAEKEKASANCGSRSDGQEARRECAAVLQALVEAVAAAVAADAPEPPNRRRSRIPVRVAERPWTHVYAAPPVPRSNATLRRRPRPRPPHAALLLTQQPLASCS